MWPTIIALIVFIIFITWYFVYNAQLLLSLAINLPMLYIVIARAWAELEERQKYYLFGLFLAVAVAVFSMDTVFDQAKAYKIWFPTLLLVITFLAAQAFYSIEKYTKLARKS